MTEQKWHYTHEDGTQEVVEVEKWIWGVVYKATPEAIEAAKQATIERDTALNRELREKLHELYKRKAKEETIERVRAEYDAKMQHPIEPEREELHQFDRDHVFHRISEIEVDRVDLWVLYESNGDRRIDIVLPEGAKIVHKYRNFIFHAATPHEYRERVYVFGYKPKGNLAHYNYVMPNGTIIQSYGEVQPKLSQMGL